MDYLDSVNNKRKGLQERQLQEFLHKQKLAVSKETAKEIVEAINEEATKTRTVKLENDIAEKEDIQDIIEQLKEVQLAQLMGNQKAQGKPAVILANGTDVEDIMAPLASKIDEALKTLANNNKDEKVAKALDKSFKDFAKAMSLYMVKGTDESRKTSQDLQDAIASLDLRPVVNVPAPKVNVQSNPQIDLSPLETRLDALRKAIEAIPSPVLDTTEMTLAVDAVRSSIENMRFPVPNYVLPFRDHDGAATQVELNPDGSMPVSLGTDGQTPAIDIFGTTINAQRYNQIEIDFVVDPDSITDITVTKTTTGDATSSNGQAYFSTGTSTTGGVKAVTNTSVTYRPHSESYAAFSAIFTTGVANSYQRIGIYDSTNGFFVGFEGSSFGITYRRNTSDTTIAQSSFNIDTLTGANDSEFTRNYIPEALDPTKDNLYRIRFGWLGAANVVFEVMSPDGNWVMFHLIRYTNINTVPSLTNPNLPITLDVKKSSGATNLIMNTACWAAGATSSLQKLTSTLTDSTLAPVNRSVITGVTTGGGGGYVNVKVNPSGALAVEASLSKPTTGTTTTASVTNSNTTVLASNNARLGATIYNEGSVDCYIKLGSTASATSYTLKMITDGYYEVPFGFTGIITGITASGTATLRISELT